MTKTKKVSAKIKVNADQTTVFNAISDWESQSRWIFATKVRGITEDSHRLGGKLEAFTGIGKIGFLDTMTITKWSPPQLCEVTHTGKFVKGSGVFEVKSEDEGTIFCWTEYTVIPFGLIGELGWIFISPITKLGIKTSLRQFSKMFNNKNFS